MRNFFGLSAALLASVALQACGPTSSSTPGAITASVAIALAPLAATTPANGRLQFSAAVSGVSHPDVIWSVQEGAPGGSIGANGLYTAPAAAGTFHVIAFSQASPGTSATATITVTPLSAIAVELTPTSLTLIEGQSKQFAASVTGATDASVSWYVIEGQGGGTVSASGLYVAPATVGTFHLAASSNADANKSAVATITVVPPAGPVAVSIDPPSSSLAAGAAQQFNARVTGSGNAAVRWTVEETGGGTIDDSGAYLAPRAGGTFHVLATSVADSSKSAEATITVTPAQVAGVAVSPPAASLAAGAQQQLIATVTNAASTAVTWSVDESGAGAVTASGLFTAPFSGGTFHVRATSVADPARSAAATITVSAPAPISVLVSPPSPSIAADSTLQLSAVVSNTGQTGVTWTVQEGSGGAVNTAGLYTAPHTAGTYHVIATSVADTTKAGSAVVTVAAPPPITVAVTPKSGFMQTSTSQPLTATVSYAANTQVTWAVVGSGSGTVTSAGIYTAPASPGTYSVTATSVADTSKSDTATFTVTTTPPVVSVTVNPSGAEVATHGAIQLNALVSGSANQTVTWSVISANGGTVSATGLYTAPAAPGTYTVKATSQVNAGNFGTASIKVDSVSVAVSPATKSLPQGATQQFAANVTFGGAAQLDQTVTWSVQEGAAGGSISASGLYTAPSAPTVAHVLATSNADPSVSSSAAVTVTAPIAAAPTNIVAIAGNQSVNLTWSASPGAVSYNIYFAPHGLLASASAAGLIGAGSGVNVTGLTNGQSYDFALTSVNTGGESAGSAPISATPLDGTAPGVVGYWPADQSVAIPLVAGPYLEFSKSMKASTLQSAFTLKAGATPVAGTVTYDGLRATFTPNTPLDSRALYTASVASTALDSFGNPFAGLTWSFTTQAEASGALRVLVGNNALTLSWNPVTGANAYTVYRSTTAGGPYQLFYGTAGLSFTDTSVSNGTNYYYVVTALTSDGEGAPTNEAFGSPSGNVPSAPYNLVAAAANGQVILSWPYAGPALTYRIFRGTASGGPYSLLGTSGNSLGYVDRSAALANGTTYFYVVRSLDTQQNSSANSPEANATPSAARLAAPQGVTHQNGNGYVSLGWSPVAGALGYTVLRTTTAGGPYTPIAQLPAATSSYVDTTPANGTTYFYVVAAIDGLGSSTFSAEVEGDPASYLNVQAAVLSVDPAYAYNGHLRLNWTDAPGATSYQLQRAIGAGSFATIVTTSGNSYNDSALADGASYSYRVISVNQTFSATSNTVAASPQHVTVGAPANVIARPGPGYVTLTWTPSPGATSYTVKYGITSGNYSQTGASASTLPVATFPVANGNPLYFVVIASGPANDGSTQTAQSAEVTTTPLAAPTLPNGPSNAASIGGDGQVNLSWTPSVSTQLVTYNVYRTVGLQAWTLLNPSPLTVPWFIDTNVTNEKSYSYAIAPITNGTENAWSPSPFLLTPTAGVMEPPKNLVGHPGNNYVTVTWDAVPGATSYIIYTSANQGGPYTYYTSAAQNPSINLQVSPNQSQGLPGGYVIVRAGNQSGYSAYSIELPLYPDSKYPGVGSLTALSGANVVTLTWQSLARATGYNVYRATSNGTWQKIGSTSQFVTGWVDATATNDVLYYYAISGTLSGADSVWSNVVTGTPHAKTLPAPRNLVGHAGNASVTVSWDPVPGANLYFLYTANIAGGPYQYYTNLPSNTYTVTGLGNGTPAHFVVTASAAEGSVTSDYSAELTITPFADNPPGKIALSATYFTATLDGNDGAYVAWSPLPAASGYHLYRSVYNSASQAQVWTLVGTPSGVAFTDSIVANGTSYQYAVAGIANGQEGPWGFSGVVTPKSTDPLAPTGIYTHPGNNSVSLSWDAVAGATSYYVYGSATPGGPYAYAGSASTPEANLFLGNGSTAYYVVLTNAAQGQGGYSQEVAASSSSGLPATPSVTTPLKTSGRLNLTWYPVTGASSYLVYRYNPGAAHWTLIGQTSSTSYNDATVVNGTGYQYVVSALNGGGAGAWSEPTSLVTPG